MSSCHPPRPEFKGMFSGGDGAPYHGDSGGTGGAVGKGHSDGELPWPGSLQAGAELAIDQYVVLYKAHGEFVSVGGDASRMAGESKDFGTSSWRCRSPRGPKRIVV